MNLPIKFSDEILNARDRGLPIVALESTIITHGMPYPQNLTTAIEVEEIVRRNKAVPATIAIINGEISIGMSKPQLTQLARATDARKLSPFSKLDNSLFMTISISFFTFSQKLFLNSKFLFENPVFILSKYTIAEKNTDSIGCVGCPPILLDSLLRVSLE